VSSDVRQRVVAAIVRKLESTGYLGTAGGWLVEQTPEPAETVSALGRLTPVEARLLVAAGLIEEDIRFGALFASLQEPLAARRPCIGLLAWLLCEPDETAAELTARCHDLVRRGLLTVDNPTDPRSEWVLRVPVPVWDLVSTGRVQPASLPPQITLRDRTEFPKPDELAVSPGAEAAVASLPDLVAEDRLSAILVRGMTASGRTTVLGSLAAQSGQDVLQYDGDVTDPAWQVFAALAAVADVFPVLRCTPGPGDTVTVPALPGLAGPLGVVCGRTGSVTGPPLARVLAITLDSCGPDDRRLLWGAAGLDDESADLDEIVERFLLPPGNILRAAPLAALAARAAGRGRVTPADVRTATRTMRRQELDTLATRLEPLELGPVLTPSAGAELDTLVSRCRHREHLVLHSAGGHSGLNRGVRALFAGPSGTGKTLTARHLAAVLDLDLYRVDLAAVVNKYIGETERNLDRVLSRAEELDVLLLLDEGDALMTRRTDVSNANDRYANLETNFLLQRLETFDGIVIVTSNAAGRIDPAFLRRIDVTVDFVPPDAEQRWQIWSEHLPLDHEVSSELLTDVSRRCPLTGGQIRNAALHALLLSLDRDEPVSSDDLLDAVRREYRRTGAAYPLEAVPSAAPSTRRAGPTW
jgi:molybdopterin-guanine dinucleotide biosynthesis protein